MHYHRWGSQPLAPATLLSLQASAAVYEIVSGFKGYILWTLAFLVQDDSQDDCSFWKLKGSAMGRIDIPLGPEADEAQKPRCAWCGDISRTVCGRCKVRWYCTPRFALRMLLMDNKRVAAKPMELQMLFWPKVWASDCGDLSINSLHFFCLIVSVIKSGFSFHCILIKVFWRSEMISNGSMNLMKKESIPQRRRMQALFLLNLFGANRFCRMSAIWLEIRASDCLCTCRGDMSPVRRGALSILRDSLRCTLGDQFGGLEDSKW